MAVTFRAQSYALQAFGTSLSVAKPTGVTDDDILILVVSINGAGTPTASGWTQIASVDTTAALNPNRLVAYYKIASSEPSSYTITMNSSRAYNANIIAWYSDSAALPLFVDAYATYVGTASTAMDAPSITTTVDNTIMHCVYTLEGSVSGTPASGFTERWENSAITCASYGMTGAIASAGSTGVKTATDSGAILYSSISLAVAETASDENLYAANIGAYILLSSNLPDGDPTSLTATPVSSSQINLAWLDNATNETGYIVERSYPTSSAFSTLAVIAANSTSYSDTGLTPDRTYYYRVRAYTLDGYSAYSNTASAHTFAIVAPESGAGDPLIGNPDDKFTVELTNPANDLRQPWLDNANVRVLYYGAMAQGGYDRAELAVGSTDTNILWDVARKVGWLVTIRNRDHSPVWAGMIEGVEIDLGNAQIGLSLENMYNRIAVVYSYDDGNGVTTRATTAWAEDTESSGRYGTKELIYSLGDASADQAEAQRDTLLANLSKPAPVVRMMRSGQLGATVRCIGLWHTLDWVYYANSEGLEENNLSSGSAQPLGQGYTASTIGLTADGRIHDKTAGRIAALTGGHNIEISGTSGGTNDGTALLDGSPRDSETYTNTTISFVATSDIDDSEEALRPFSRDDLITVSGSSSNDGDYVVQGGGSAGINVTSTGISGESAGSTVTITSAENIRTDQTFTEEAPSSSITLTVHGVKIDQAFTPTVNASWTVNKIFIRARKVGSPADNLKVELCADSSGAPGSVLDSQTVAGSSLGTVAAWVTFDLANTQTIAYGTTYHLVVSRSGSNDIDDYYVIDVDEDLGYAGGAMKLWDGSAWVTRATAADLIFRITGATETTAQVSDIYDACGQFFTALDVVDASGVYSNQYRAGDNPGGDEMAALLNPGTGSTRLLATVTPERILRITEQAANGDDNLLLSGDGSVMLRNNRPLPHGVLPTGKWLRLADVPGNVDQLAALRNIFIERAEFHASDDNLRLEALGDASPWDIGKITDRELSRQAEKLKPYIKSWDG